MAGLDQQLQAAQARHSAQEESVSQLETPSRIVGDATANGSLTRPSHVTQLPYVSLNTPLATPNVTPAAGIRRHHDHAGSALVSVTTRHSSGARAARRRPGDDGTGRARSVPRSSPATAAHTNVGGAPAPRVRRPRPVPVPVRPRTSPTRPTVCVGRQLRKADPPGPDGAGRCHAARGGAPDRRPGRSIRARTRQRRSTSRTSRSPWTRCAAASTPATGRLSPFRSPLTT